MKLNGQFMSLQARHESSSAGLSRDNNGILYFARCGCIFYGKQVPYYISSFIVLTTGNDLKSGL